MDQEIVFKKSPRAKRLSLKIGRDGSVSVTVPRFVSLKRAQRFAQQHERWIQKKLEKLPKGQRPLTKYEREELRTQAKTHLPERTRSFAQLHSLKIANVTIRNQKTRWGSCSAKNSISLNCELMRLPERLRDYVILHELAHVKHKNHSKRFWDYLEEICPGSKKLDTELKQFAIGYKES